MKEYFLIGKKLPHSYSAVIHRERGFDYSLKELDEESLGGFLLKKNYVGLNVTMPYKSAVIDYLDETDFLAKKIGAVNTIVNRDGKLAGYNTDIFGLDFALKSAGIDLAGKTVAILGSGGAGKTAKTLAEENGAKKIYVVSRKGEINYGNCYDVCKRAEIVINCTPVGAYPFDAASPIDLSKLKNLEGAFDCAYNPARSEFILQAQELKLKNANGLNMLVYQALAAEKLWNGTEFSDDDVIKLADKIYKSTRNIALVGMPGAGKTVIAKRLGAVTDREVIDTDEVILRNYGITAGEMINRYGEDYFRDVESRVVDEASQRRGVIIATGGGSVLKRENRKAIKRSSLVVWIKRDLNLLSSNDRPLSANRSPEELYNMRKSLYKSVCDYEIYNDDTVDKAAEEIAEL